MTSAYLDSDSEEELNQLSDNSDAELPTFDILRSPEKNSVISGVQVGSSLFLPTCPISDPNCRPSHPHKPHDVSSPVSKSICPVNGTDSRETNTLFSPHKPFPSPAKVIRPAIPKTPDKLCGFSSPGCSTDLSSVGQAVHSPSPSKLVERHQKALYHQNRLTRKVEKLTAGMKLKQEKTSKLEEYRSAGGIFGLSKHLDEHVRSTSSEGDADEEASDTDLLSLATKQQRLGYNESNKFPFPFWAPGYLVFVSPPDLILELYPPGYHKVEGEGPYVNLEKNIMEQQNPRVLHQLICERWFMQTYRAKPCPRCIWEWLFQIMCLSHDQQLALMAFVNLKTLIEWTRESVSVYVPDPCTVVGVMVSLGADRDRLAGVVDHMTKVKENTVDHMTASEPSDDVFQSSFVEIVSHRISNLSCYVSLAVSANPSLLSSDQLHHLFYVFTTASLDSSLNKNPSVLTSIAQCLSSLVAAIPESSWKSSLALLSAQMLDFSTHHHDFLHLNRMISPVSPRMKQLRKTVCKASIWKIVFPETVPLPEERSDRAFAWRIIKHYYKMPASQFVYYPMYNVMCMFSDFTNMSTFGWSSQEKKLEFKSMLSSLAQMKIKDTADNTERAPVKDLLIRMSLEMATRRSRGSTQTDLFSVMRT